MTITAVAPPFRPLSIPADYPRPGADNRGRYDRGMCRNIRQLHNFEPPATSEEVEDAALQYVRKISGSNTPSKANTEAFDRAVAEVAEATQRLLDGLVTKAPPKDRAVEAAKRKARSEQRFAAA